MEKPQRRHAYHSIADNVTLWLLFFICFNLRVKDVLEVASFVLYVYDLDIATGLIVHPHEASGGVFFYEKIGCFSLAHFKSTVFKSVQCVFIV